MANPFPYQHSSQAEIGISAMHGMDDPFERGDLSCTCYVRCKRPEKGENSLASLIDMCQFDNKVSITPPEFTEDGRRADAKDEWLSRKDKLIEIVW